jgi:hypothetical protein
MESPLSVKNLNVALFGERLASFSCKYLEKFRLGRKVFERKNTLSRKSVIKAKGNCNILLF